MLPKLSYLVSDPYLDSENVNVAVGDIIVTIVAVTDYEQIQQFFPPLIKLILDLLEDSTKEVKTKSCKCLSVLCRSNPKEIMDYSTVIIDSLIQCLKHPDLKVRSSALEALGQYMYTVPLKYRHRAFEYILSCQSELFHDIIKYSKDNVFSNMIRDEEVTVRDMFYRVVADWIMQLSDKNEFDQILVPIILIGLTDPIEEVREVCWEQITEIGMTWENNNYKLVPAKNIADQDFIPYPWHPFQSRPRYGVQQYFSIYFHKILNDLLKELTNFMSAHREIASKLLLSLLILSENLPMDQTTSVIFTLMRAIQESDNAEFKNSVFQCLEVLGRHVEISKYFAVISESRTKPSFFCMVLCIDTPVVSVFSQLSTLTYLVKGSLQRKIPCEVIKSLDDILKFVNAFERSRESLVFVQVLIDNYADWSKTTSNKIFKLLLEHDHESVLPYMKKIMEFASIKFSIKESIDELLLEISKLSSSFWKSINVHVISI